VALSNFTVGILGKNTMTGRMIANSELEEEVQDLSDRMWASLPRELPTVAAVWAAYSVLFWLSEMPRSESKQKAFLNVVEQASDYFLCKLHEEASARERL
jgi:hypothetical protein